MTRTKTQAITVAISGIEGSFSEEAARTYLSRHDLDGLITYATTADGTFQAVMSGKVERGVIPLENSNGGIVHETVYAMAKYVFDIHEIFEIDVQQNLLVIPGTDKSQIKHIVSHPQALAQCKFYLRRNWETTEHTQYNDTALAAKDLASGKLSPDTAVIASRRAAQLFNLEIAQASIQDLKFNFTSFLVVTKPSD